MRRTRYAQARRTRAQVTNAINYVLLGAMALGMATMAYRVFTNPACYYPGNAAKRMCVMATLGAAPMGQPAPTPQ